MTVTKKTAADYAAELEQAINDRNSTYDTKIGPVPDLIINPTSAVLELQNERIRSVQQLLSLINDGSFTDADVDDFVYNELLLRHTGGRARVTLIFSRATLPTSDLTIRANFPVATLADEETGSSITFYTLAEATLVAVNAANYFNTTTQRYELPVVAEAISGGTAGNVGSERATRNLRPLVGFDSVFNRDPATGGTDPEVTNDLVKRYYISLLGTSPSVVGGIRKILGNFYPEIFDSNVIYGNNPLNVRGATDGGAVDVYFIGSTEITAVDVITFVSVGQIHVLANQPVVSIASIPGYVQGVDYELVKDTSGNMASVRATDGVRWIVGGAAPVPSTSISVTYKYNSLNATLQADFLDENRDTPGRDILFKNAQKIDIELAANIKFRSGYNVSTLLASINDAILQLINNKLLGEDIEISDIQLVVRSFTGVDNFIVTNLDLAGTGSTTTTDFIVEQNQYARISPTNLVLTVI